MKITRQALIYGLFVVSVLFDAALCRADPAVAAANSTTKAWVLEQTTDQYGLMKVYLSAAGMRVESVKSGIVTIAHAPDWSIVSFLPAVKKYAACKRDKFRGPSINQLAILTRGDLTVVPLVLKKHATVDGVKTAEYQTPKAFEDIQMGKYINRDVHPSSVRHVVYQVADSLGLPAQEGEIMARYYGIPIAKGVPFTFTSQRVGGGDIPLVALRSCKSKVVPVSLFSLPTGFSQLASMESLLSQSASGKGGMDLILKEMDSKEGFMMDGK